MCGYRCVGAGAKIQIPPYTKVSQSDSATRIGARPSAPAAKAHHNVGGGRASLTPPQPLPARPAQQRRLPNLDRQHSGSAATRVCPAS